MKTENLFQCECSTHLIGVEYDNEFKQTYISFYYYANLRSSFWYRIKQAINILFDRRYEIDTFILSEAGTLRLSKTLLANVLDATSQRQ